MPSFFNLMKVYFVVLTVLLIIDLPVVLAINKKPYADQFAKINNNDSPSGFNVWMNASISYLLLAYGIYYFGVSPNNYWGAMIFGLCAYGVYNTTNLATIKNYDQKLATMDTAWGVFLSLIVMAISSFIANRFILNESAAEVETTTDVE